ncbi:DUF1801 domain-containing protein [Celeribacter marinus]|uniref:DUF1801 domain-containing protein n=1 Tax=Celeribacter marinus TaxID=1397108 RepID=UPI00316C0815
MDHPAFASSEIAHVYDACPAPVRATLLALRTMIYAEAVQLGVPVTESLKWGQPSYATPKGTPLRLGHLKTGGAAIYSHCQSRVIPELRDLAPDLNYDGTRAVHLDPDHALPVAPLRLMIRRALTYRT